jgi:ABC-type nitrate/sulfonate/bicarbonate transport system substrate-binding protein
MTSAMPEPFSVGTVSSTFFNMPLWIAQERGFLRDENLEVSLAIFGNASQIPPLLDGTYHAVIGSPELAMQNAAAGGPLRIVAGNAGAMVHSLIARAPFTRIEDLRGRTIGIINQKEGTFFALRVMMAAHGLNFPGDYQVKETGGVPPRHKALLAGEIDAGLQSVPWNYVAEDEGMNNLGEVAGYVPDWQFVTLNANREWAQANRDRTVRFLRALLRGTAWLYANRAGAAEIAARRLPSPLGHAERAWDYFTGSGALTRDMAVNAKGLARVIATQKEAGLLPQDAPDAPEFYIAGEYLRAARG